MVTPDDRMALHLFCGVTLGVKVLKILYTNLGWSNFFD